MSTLNKYYLQGLVPFIIFWFFLFSIGISFFNQTYVLIGFIFPYVFYAPGIEDRALARKHRLSVLGVLFRLNRFVVEKMTPLQDRAVLPFSRMILPLLFSFFLWLLSKGGIFLFSLIGSLLWELFFWMRKKPRF